MTALVLAIAVAGCVSPRREAPPQPTVPPGVPEELAKVWEAYRALQERYVNREALDSDNLADGAIRGMIEALEDPFTAYFDAGQFRSSLEDIEGAFEGIGASVTIRDGNVTVVAPLPDTPAERAGIQPGDVILQVEDESIEGLALEGVIDRIRGPEGTPVRLLIQREGRGEIEIVIVRARIQVTSVSVSMLTEKVARVRVTQFVRPTSEELRQVLIDLSRQEVDGIVLDLRNNPGGLLTVVVEVASQFLDDGLVLYEMDSAGKRTDWKVLEGGLAREVPLVVLVNKGSASGSEVVAGAVQAHRRGPVIGTETFGKGVVNIPQQLSDGSGLYISTAYWFTPSGEQISSRGLTPDIRVERTQEDIEAERDPQLDRALEVLETAIARQEAALGVGAP